MSPRTRIRVRDDPILSSRLPLAAFPGPRACPLLRRPSAGSVLIPGPLRLVLRSDAGASSDGLSVGPACIRLVRVGPGRMSCLPCRRLLFRHKRLMELDEQSGRTTGRLGYTWPTTAYAIGGTATLALRYSIISATAAARTRPQG